ncbi:MAG: acyltransferase, partial [Bacteriovorax sp.]|nr:acyltransferase [Bacteriovorax sp.]
MNFYKAFFLEKEIKSLDGLRAMACLMVIIAHLVEVHGSGLNSYLQQALDLGKEGVAFFFTISGFIITYLLLREKKSKDTIKIKKFVLRRSIKIIPVLYLFLIFLVILNQLNFVKIHPDNFLSSFLFFRNYSNAPYSAFTGHVWSLAVEEHFYFFWPAIILFLNKKHLFYFAIFVILISPLIRVGTFYYFPELHIRQDIMTHCRIDSFMFGALLAMAYFEDKLKWLNSKIKHPALTLWCLIIFYCLIHPTLKMHSFKG